MFEFINNEDDRGQVGIGTLIVFIAMVLVAAIAAGVLINTAGVLQTQAESTGDQAQSQVSDRIQVQSAAGEVGGISDGTNDGSAGSGDLIASSEIDSGSDSGPLVYQVDLTVTKAPGANNVDLSETTAELITNAGVNQVVLEESVGGESGEPVSIEPITAESESDIVITDSGDRYTVSFYGYENSTGAPATQIGDSTGSGLSSVNNAAWIGNLTGGSTMEIRLTTAAGATTIEEVVVPDSLVERDAVSL